MPKSIYKAELKVCKMAMDKQEAKHRRMKVEIKRIKRASKANLGRLAMRESGLFDEALEAANFEKQKKS